MTEMAVFCNGVTKQYEQTCALNELNLSIHQGGVVGVLGPNGAGKSTLFRLLTGLTRVDKGEIKVLGKRPGWQTNRQIAYLPDRARWYTDHTVGQAFTWGQAFLPGFNRLAAEKMADFMKLNLEMRVAGMSRGQEARLMLILCLARDVPLILLDEPFSGIDAISREQIITEIINHMGDGTRTLFISTHEINEAESMFDHAVFLNDGQVTLSGDADELRGQFGSMHSIMQKLYR